VDPRAAGQAPRAVNVRARASSRVRALLADRRITVAVTAAGVIIVAGVMFRPVSNNAVLYSAFLLLGVIAAVGITVKRPRVPVEMYAIAYSVLAIAVYGILIGPANAGLPYTLLIWCLAPALWWVVSVATDLRALRWFFLAAAVVTIALAVTLLSFVAGEGGTIPQLVPQWAVDQLGLGATFSSGSTQARMYGLSSLAALGPAWFASVFIRRDAVLPHIALRIVCAVLAAVAAVVSNRTAIVAVIAVAPILLLVTLLLLGVRAPEPRRLRAGAVGAGAIGAAGALSLGAYAFRNLEGWGPLGPTIDNFVSLFSGAATYDSADQSIRADQVSYLLEAWMRFPIVGAGFGARVPDYPRTSERPWVLELQYHLLAYHIGLVGLLALIAILVIGLLLVRRATATSPQLRSTMAVSVVTAMAMIIANSSNPYLQAPGHMWALFLPLAVACAVLTSEASNRSGVWKDRS